MNAIKKLFEKDKYESDFAHRCHSAFLILMLGTLIVACLYVFKIFI